MNTVDLESLEGLPSYFIEELKQCNLYFSRAEFLETIRNNPEISSVIERINEYCMHSMVIGYHYTRAIPEDLLNSGLKPRSGEEIRRQFLEKFGSLFSEQQILNIKEAWGRCYNEQIRSVRDNRIYFNFTKSALGNRGAELLLKYYGGEQVYFHIVELSGVSEVLASIGKPFIVRCKLIPSEVKSFLQYPWGEIAVSSYHRMVNPEAYPVDQDGCQFTSVPPERIELLHVEH